MITIKEVASQETYTVRQQVLRQGKPIESCIFDGDDAPSTFHLGLYESGLLAGIVSVFQSASSYFNETDQYQMRGMAVLETRQKKGLGEKLVSEAERLVAQKQGKVLWFNAREAATGFYRKLGYKIIGDVFTIGDIGPHYVMFKKFR